MPLLPRRSDQVQDKLHRLEEQIQAMSSRIDEMTETLEARHADDEAAAIAAERIRSGAADHKEDGAEALATLGIEIPTEE
jgi:Arc/MetJ-type ribon-helix-helix transcriptional regulator